MNGEKAERFVKSILESEGFRVESIPTTASKSADFLVADAGHKYTIEVTTKSPDRQWQDLVQRADDSGFAADSRRLSYSNLLDGILGRKFRQVLESDVDTKTIPLIWIVPESGYAGVVRGLLRQALYGMAIIVDRREGNFAKECFFFERFAFFRYPALAGVICGDHQGIQLFVNSLFDGVALFRESNLYSMFAKADAAIDPEERVANGTAIALDVKMDRTSNEVKLAVLSAKYGIDAFSMGSWNRIQVLADVPKSMPVDDY